MSGILEALLTCRFALQLEVGMPDAKQREAILRLYLKKQAAESRFFEGSVTVDEDLLSVSLMFLLIFPAAAVALLCQLFFIPILSYVCDICH